MESLGELAARIYFTLHPLTEWALRNWLLTMVILIGLIYWTGRQRRGHR